MSFLSFFDQNVMRVRVVQKTDSLLMKILACCFWVLNKVRITHIDDFMNRYITTIGHTIYATPGWSMDMNVTSTVIHELTHIAEYQLYPWYSTKYLLFAKDRAFYETTCMQAEIMFNPENNNLKFIADRAKNLVGYDIPFELSIEEGLCRLNEISANEPQLPARRVINALQDWKRATR